AILPAVSQNNNGGFAIAAWGSSLHDGAQMLVTGQTGNIALSSFRLSNNLLGLLPFTNIPNPNPPQLTAATNLDSPMVADNGNGVATSGGKAMYFTAGGNLQAISNVTGKYAAISDDGLVAFIGNA